ncbi:MAG: hypothetical protein L0271_16335 [Gemmatimonadetes bacterium]|nr:hypothetical protein [Gemmatimonadota bacterium]
MTTLHEDPTTADDHDDPAARSRLKRVAVRVIVVQILALIGLWLLQTRFGT